MVGGHCRTFGLPRAGAHLHSSGGLQLARQQPGMSDLRSRVTTSGGAEDLSML